MKKLVLILPFILIFTSCFDELSFNIPDENSYVAFNNSVTTVSEGVDQSTDIKIIYSGPQLNNDLQVPVNIIPSDGQDAEEGVDFTISDGLDSITIPAGQASTVITIEIINNDIAAGPRDIVLELGNVEGHELGLLGSGDAKSARVTILEDDFNTFGFTSFEEPEAGEINNYSSSNGTEQTNNPGENPVDYTSVGGELGFNTSYVPGQEGGADSGLLFGVTKFTADANWEYDIGSFADGDQAYATSDADGLMEIVFDEITLPNNSSFLIVDLQTYFVSASWESDDEFDVFWRTEDGDELIISLRANDNEEMTDSPDGSGNVITDQWTLLQGNVENIKTGRLVIQIGTDSGSEICFIDDIIIKGI